VLHQLALYDPHADAFVEADGAQVLRLDFQFDAF